VVVMQGNNKNSLINIYIAKSNAEQDLRSVSSIRKQANRVRRRRRISEQLNFHIFEYQMRREFKLFQGK
jgi:hypothetical protein